MPLAKTALQINRYFGSHSCENVSREAVSDKTLQGDGDSPVAVFREKCMLKKETEGFNDAAVSIFRL